MKVHRIYSVLLKTFYITRKSPDRMADLFYWSVIDLLIWGLTSSYFTQFAPHSKILEMILSGFIFWIIVWRGQQEVSINLLEDLWNKNLVNLFVSPFTFSEWIVSFLIVSILKTSMSFLLASAVAALVYKVNVFSYGLYILPFILVLLVSAWGLGFFIAGLILRFGTKVQNLAWSFVTIVAPFSAIYYPLSILPKWAQYLAQILPTSYVFQGIHTLVQTGRFDVQPLLVSAGIALLYLVSSLFFIRASFQKVLQKGLVKVF